MTTKKTITIKAGKILGALSCVEGTCAAVLVDKGLKMIPMNPIVKYIGRSAISALIQMPFAAAGSYLWLTDNLDIVVPYGKERLLEDYELTEEKSQEICDELQKMCNFEIEEMEPVLKLNALYAIRKLYDSKKITNEEATKLVDKLDLKIVTTAETPEADNAENFDKKYHNVEKDITEAAESENADKDTEKLEKNSAYGSMECEAATAN